MISRIAIAVLALSTVNTLALNVVSTVPPLNALNQSVHTRISVTFDQPINPETVTAGVERFFAGGRWSGPVAGSKVFSNGNRTVTLIPDERLFAGEMVFVNLSDAIETTGGERLRKGGYSFSFWTHVRRAPMEFSVIDTLVVRTTPQQPTQAYGGIASDLNNDGYSDVTIVNEITEDLRTFLNTADGSGLMQPFIQPPASVGDRASPSEPADFNHDGEIDICVANIDDDTLSVLFGNGDGTFTPAQTIPVGDAPRGITVLDANGDGWLDIASTNSGTGSTWSLMLNNGDGSFGLPVHRNGGTAEWSMAAADMNNDGLTDVVVGYRTDQRIETWLSDGSGGFTAAGSTLCGGRTWMIAIGDVNADGFVDVATGNSTSATAAILINNGDGTFAPARVHNVGAFTIATDLGDLDGDGDLDWTTASFSSSQWEIFTNDGSGTFAPFDVVAAPNAGSCTLIHDFDNDGDADLSLIDEIADVVFLYENSGKALPSDFDGNGSVDLSDFQKYLDCAAEGNISVDCEVFDADLDRDVDFADFVAFQRNRTVR